MKRLLAIAALPVCLLLPAGLAFAADQSSERERIQTQEQHQEHISDSHLMTEKEREEYRARMRAATTEEERRKIRTEHHERMKKRYQSNDSGATRPPSTGGGTMPGGSGMGGGNPGKRR